MLPEEVEKSLRKLGDDGAKVRGALERDFAAYAKQAQQGPRAAADAADPDRRPAAPVGATKAAAGWLFRTDDEGFQARLAQIRERAARQSGERRAPMPRSRRTPTRSRRAEPSTGACGRSGVRAGSGARGAAPR